jgi:KDO2-lipid IV(A) lauroyltransferase
MARKRHWTLVPPVEFLIYVAVRVALAALQALSWRQALAAGRWVGRVLRVVGRRHARIARKNLDRSPAVVPPAEVPEFLDRVYDSLGRSLMELLWVPRILARRGMDRVVRLERFHVFDRLLEEGKGVIAVIGHLGNYELTGLAACLAGYPLHSLARPIVNRWIDRYLERIRRRTGQRIIPREGALGEMIRVLRRNGILVIQIDQDAKEGGLLVDFLGRPASTHRSPALLALKYGVPIVPTDIYRKGDVNYCVLEDPIDPVPYRDRPDAVEALTAEVSRRFERQVRAHPDQWWWVFDRWRGADKRIAKGESGGAAGPPATS